MFDTLPKDAREALNWGLEQYTPYFDELIARPLNAENVDAWLMDWSQLARLTQEISARIEVATTVDTTDVQAEQRFEAFFENVFPALMIANNQLNQKLVASGFEPEGFEIPLRNMRADIELFREENLPLSVEERKYILEFDKIKGAQTVDWDGQELTLDQLQPLLQSTDRATRERAWQLSMQRQLQDRDALNELWGKLLDVRVRIAANAGFSDYRAYRWKAMKRFDYSPEDSLAFGEAIAQVVVPVALRLYDERRQQLSLDSLRPWDTDVDIKGRPPLRPYHTPNELPAKMETIFRQVDPQLGDYFQIMRTENLLDLESRKGKGPGGFCTEYNLLRRPFIFMNGVGIHEDVQTLLHEGGHAFHVFESAHLPYVHQLEVPMEFAEVASMAMELLGSPYLSAEQGGYYTAQDAARARIEHLESILKFWPYMAVVDGFQHWVYCHPQEAADPSNCDMKWGELWDYFMPGIDYSGLEDIKVTGWHRKLHIFTTPLYYIEYGLALLGSVQVWANALNHGQAHAVSQYRKALSLGGSVTLPQLFETAGAKFAFDASTLNSAVELLERTIEQLKN